MELLTLIFLLLSQICGFDCAVAPSISNETTIPNISNQNAKGGKDVFIPIEGITDKTTTKIPTTLTSAKSVKPHPTAATTKLTTAYPSSSHVTAVTDYGKRPPTTCWPYFRIWRIYGYVYPRYSYNWNYGFGRLPERNNYGKIRPVYTNYFVVKINGGKRKAKKFMKNLGYKYIGKVFPKDNYYVVLHKRVCRRCRYSAINQLKKEKQITWVRQQRSRLYQPRHLPFSESDDSYYNIQNDFSRNVDGDLASSRFRHTKEEMNFNDPYYYRQWYLHRSHFHHINIQTVWKAGYAGRGIHVSVLDDGVHPDNPDLGENYDPSISYDYVHFQKADESNVERHSHGTSCAGIIAAIANNSLCGVGIAYKARIGGSRVLDGPMTDAQEAMALTHALDKVDIYSASWGPRDDGKHMGRPRILVRKAFIKGITEGRNGKGSIYVWASGNGGKYHDNCNLDGYASSIYTVAIGALTADGQSAYYSESCSATLASTYIGGSHFIPTKRTLPAIKRMIKVVVPGDHGNCRQNFQGTSAAAPMAAGIIALLLEANPELTWRDVQHVIVKSSRIPSTNEVGWLMNAAGYHYHIKAGFGVMDCGRMVAMAQNWTLIAPQRIWMIATHEKKLILAGEVTDIVLLVNTWDIPVHHRIDALEHVIATLNILHNRRKDLEIYLISPSNTVSQLLSLRPMDSSRRGFRKWRFTSVHFWGEDPHGEWKLKIRDLNPDGGGYINFIDYFSLTLYGTSSAGSAPRNPAGRILDTMAVRSIEREERMLSRSVRVRNISNVDLGRPLHRLEYLRNKVNERD